MSISAFFDLKLGQIIMRIALGCDHAGFPLKQRVASLVQSAGHEIIDCGTDSNCAVDYPDYARKVGETIIAGKADRGILVCGSGVGVSVAANKIPGIRAAICHDTYSAHQGVEHDSMNVLCIGARIVGEEVATELIRAFLNAQFTQEERHVRRLNKMLEIERDALAGKF